MNTLHILGKTRKISWSNIKMLVFDMAGTTVNEHGIVYDTIFDTLSKFGVGVSPREIEKWHGANKYEVFDHYLESNDVFKMHSDQRQIKIKKEVYNYFNSTLEEKYFTSDKISLIHDSLPGILNGIREKGIKVTLNTGYNKNIQSSIIDKLGMDDFIDDYISSEEVPKGRPYPYMIYKLMERNDVKSANEVIKIGDTKNDILEGINAKCKASVGVLTGADNSQLLSHSTVVIDDITKIQL